MPGECCCGAGCVRLGFGDAVIQGEDNKLIEATLGIMESCQWGKQNTNFEQFLPCVFYNKSTAGKLAYFYWFAPCLSSWPDTVRS